MICTAVIFLSSRQIQYSGDMVDTGTLQVIELNKFNAFRIVLSLYGANSVTQDGTVGFLTVSGTCDASAHFTGEVEATTTAFPAFLVTGGRFVGILYSVNDIQPFGRVELDIVNKKSGVEAELTAFWVIDANQHQELTDLSTNNQKAHNALI